MIKPISADQVLMKTLENFYANDNHFNKMYKYVVKPRESKVSLRVLEWFVINYAKKNNVGYEFEKDAILGSVGVLSTPTESIYKEYIWLLTLKYLYVFLLFTC